jgi:hypothetical protein
MASAACGRLPAESDVYRGLCILFILTAATALAGDGVRRIEPDKPTVKQPRAGDVTLTVRPAEKVKAVRAVSRATGKTWQPASFDRDTGKAVFTDLPGDANYDICLTTTDGREIEGIDMAFVDARLQRLADARRKQLGLPVRQPGLFTDKDVAAIREFVAGWEDFMDTRRILCIRGHGDRATVLVELMRLKAFHASGRGENQQIIWRVELWYMQNAGGGWERIPNVERTLRRFRGLQADWRKIHVEYTPDLTASLDAKGQSEPLNFIIPDEPDLPTSRPANTTPVLKTDPKVMGINGKK